MPDINRLHVGLVGAAGRGGSFRAALEANGARIHAVCDVRKEALAEAAAHLGEVEQYTDYERMLDHSDLDAVVIGTPQHLHADQAVQALARGLHVLSEVPAAVSLDQAQALVQAAAASRAVYMMAENYIYMRPNVVVREMVRQGLFGEPYYGQGEYLHDVTGLIPATPWRRHWQMGIDGITYPTHSLGPILQWMPGDRVARLCCEAAASHRKAPDGGPLHRDSPVMLCKTAAGRLISIRMDLTSERPHAMTNYQLQGTDGAYESARAAGERHRIWLRALSAEPRWHDLDALLALDQYAERFLPDSWRNPPPEARQAGHGGGDYFEVLDFIRAARGEAPCPVGIHEAMDMTLPGLVSQQSILQEGQWQQVPDSRSWLEDKPPYKQLRLVWPPDREPPEVHVPTGYALRCYRDDDLPSYRRLLQAVDFGSAEEGWLHTMLDRMLPEGFFVIEHLASHEIVATAMATHWPLDEHPYGAELGWVASHPEHKGKRLGQAVSAAATRRMLQAGFRNIYIRTDDWRLAALKVYLEMGYRPFPFAAGMAARWEKVYETLGRPADG